jgi:serine/threonine-protein kinase TNNI3K
MASWGRTALLLLATASTAASRSVWVAQEIFENANCSGVPSAVSLAKVSGCSPRQCSSVQVNNVTQFMTLECDIVDRFAYAEAVFGEFNYIVVEDYAGAGCDNLKLTVILPATGSCASSTVYDSYSVVASLFANGSAVISLYQDETCEGDAYMDFVLDSGNISSGDCVQDYYKFYTSASGDMMDAGSDSGSSSSSTTLGASESSSVGGLAIVGIVIAAGVVGFMTAIFVWRRRPGDEQRTEDSACVAGYDSYTSLRNVPKSTVLSTGTNNSSYSREGKHRSISYFWDDDAISAARVDRDKIEFDRVISNGGYGQVWSGWLNGQHVAVKMLLPENRKVMKHLNSFLEEVKLVSVLEHERIVRFVGVGWDSLADLCLLTEFMDGGDLRTLLSSYEAEKYPVGFSESKVRIALHVAHALTYLHSLDPPVLHRDLKSKNILLTAHLDARLTDFGVSREHVDQTMTAGVGTSRWMAPEVLMGERYDAKADVFSMGVVLSELDAHALPYSHAAEDSNPSRSLSSAAIVHLVAMGKLRVHFSSTGSVAELGQSCVAVDPSDRPTAAEALYKLHTILTTEFGGSVEG